jgi:short-subunit dehydrogenase
MNVNVKAIINVSQVIAQGMMDANTGGSIVNVSSVVIYITIQSIIEIKVSTVMCDL